MNKDVNLADAAASALRDWQTPEVRTLRAGSAEAGETPVVDEGPLGRGS